MNKILIVFFSFFLFHLLYSYHNYSTFHLLYFNYEYFISKLKLKYLILSFAINYDFYKLENFILSLNKTGYEGDLILFTTNSILSLGRHILSYKLYTVILNRKYPFYPYNNSYFPISLDKIEKILYFYSGKSFVTYRYFIIKLFIKYYGLKYKFILLTDIRDVLFQLHPFNWNIERGIYLVEEHPRRVIGGDKSNTHYVSKYKPEQKIYSSKIINGGVMFGSYPEILSFLTDFLNYICSFNCNGNDQGGLNLYIRSYTYFLYPIYILNSSHTPVKTLALWLFDSNKCCLPKNNTILNTDSSIPHLIHQYDRAIKALSSYKKYLNMYINYLDYYTH